MENLKQKNKTFTLLYPKPRSLKKPPLKLFSYKPCTTIQNEKDLKTANNNFKIDRRNELATLYINYIALQKLNRKVKL